MAAARAPRDVSVGEANLPSGTPGDAAIWKAHESGRRRVIVGRVFTIIVDRLPYRRRPLHPRAVLLDEPILAVQPVPALVAVAPVIPVTIAGFLPVVGPRVGVIANSPRSAPPKIAERPNRLMVTILGPLFCLVPEDTGWDRPAVPFLVSLYPAAAGPTWMAHQMNHGFPGDEGRLALRNSLSQVKLVQERCKPFLAFSIRVFRVIRSARFRLACLPGCEVSPGLGGTDAPGRARS